MSFNTELILYYQNVFQDYHILSQNYQIFITGLKRHIKDTVFYLKRQECNKRQNFYCLIITRKSASIEKDNF